MAPSRIDELRRRVQNDPASIAFAQLAEEYRRSGQTDEAVRICRDGLTRHPGYLSARVTLGRALLDLGELAEARGEFEFVVAEAPENLAAVRGLAEIFHREGQASEALDYYRRALALSRHDPEIEEIVQQLSRQVGAATADPAGALSFEEAHEELVSAAERVPLARPVAPPATPAAQVQGVTAPFDFDRLVAALGSPAPPPQVEAVVQGLPPATIELPEATDGGSNPFATLEAELRARDADTAPWVPPVELTAAVLPDVAAEEAPAVDASVEAEAEAEAETAWYPVGGTAAEVLTPSIDEGPAFADTADVDTQILPIIEAPSAEALSDAVADLVAALPAASGHDADPPTPADPAPEPVTEPLIAAEAVAAPPAPAPGDDVLDDLESWLSTLHDRTPGE